MHRIRIQYRVMILAIALLCLGACQNGLFSTGPRTSDADIRIINHLALKDLIENHAQRTVVIDVRTSGYEQAHIPGAIHRPLPRLRANDPQLVGDRTLVVYAQNRHDPVSAAAAKRLITLGYQNVYDYRDGLDRWQQENPQPNP